MQQVNLFAYYCEPERYTYLYIMETTYTPNQTTIDAMILVLAYIEQSELFIARDFLRRQKEISTHQSQQRVDSLSAIEYVLSL